MTERRDRAIRSALVELTEAVCVLSDLGSDADDVEVMRALERARARVDLAAARLQDAGRSTLMD